uniref:FAM192A/Fyv6 N-terminal domain-containing protein n=1 Tax=Cannabis sativa TaxID=3483 RepID=A0A803NQ09_CANSA
MADESTPPIRLMNFISEDQLDETKKARGERVEDGTAQRDRPLYEILKENKDKKDAEFNERFKHRPPKALDDDETEFLDKLELSKREYEQQVANEEAQQLRNFQAAVAAQSMIVQDFEETPPVPVVQVTFLIIYTYSFISVIQHQHLV